MYRAKDREGKKTAGLSRAVFLIRVSVHWVKRELKSETCELLRL